ncbi:MAG: hypothetical protein ABFE01_13660 [Phycisphaerales bacterium]
MVTLSIGNYVMVVVLFIAIGVAIGWAACSVKAEGARIRQCEQCGLVSDDVDRMMAPINEADDEPIETLYERRPTSHGPRATSDDLMADLANGPRVWVDLDIIEQIETGHLPENQRDAALGKAGERGRYQITEGAWNDTMAWLKRHRGYRVTWDFRARACDQCFATVIAGTYVNEILPRWLTTVHMDRNDSTRPVPDSLLARVAANNAGPKRVRQAYALWQADTGTTKPWTAYLPRSTINYLAKYEAAAAARTMHHGDAENTEKTADERG